MQAAVAAGIAFHVSCRLGAHFILSGPANETPNFSAAIALQSSRPDTAVIMLDYEITAQDLAKRLAQTQDVLPGDRLTLIDVREPWEFEAARIDGAVLMPMGDVPSRANTELDPDDAIVVVCHAGVRSMSVTAWLRNQGFEKAQSLRGGIDAWSREIDPTVPRY